MADEGRHDGEPAREGALDPQVEFLQKLVSSEPRVAEVRVRARAYQQAGPYQALCCSADPGQRASAAREPLA